MINSTTPLTQLPTVIVDFETTGLNVATDRIVQIAAIKMNGLKVEKKKFNHLINPQIPIHQKITDIHKISNQDVVGKPIFPEIQKEFHDFLENRIIIGFNIGFDLAILQNEMERYQLPKKEYRHLDIRFLGNLLDIPGRELYLENLSYYFKIPIVKRHSALGDAEITSKIYKNLIPLLKTKDIKTLAQAEKFIFDNLGFINLSYSSDWYYPKPPTSKKMVSFDQKKWQAIEKIDPFPFLYNVSDIMQEKIISIEERKTLLQAVQKMQENNIGCLLIKNAKGEYLSIISERDFVSLMSKNQSALNLPLAKLKRKELITCHKNDFIYQALGLMESKNIRHLPVLEKNKIVGILSYRDLMQRRIKDLYYHEKNIDKAQSHQDLVDIFLQLPVLTKKLFKEKITANKIAAIIAQESISITQKVIDFALHKTEKQLKSPPPTEFCILILGSTGRGESLLAFDQDNALIFEESNKNQENQKWFLTLGKHINDYLNEIGIPYCKGKVMISNLDWCQSLGDWKRKVRHWFSAASKGAMLNADIFLDFKPIYGNEKLSSALRKEMSSLSKDNFIKLMGENIIESTPYPFNFLGKLKTDRRNVIDFKKNYLFPINSLARLLALKINYQDNNSTPSRLRASQKVLDLNEYEMDVFIRIHAMSLEIVLREQLKKLSLGEKADNLIYFANVPKLVQDELHRLLPIFKNIDNLIRNYLIH